MNIPPPARPTGYKKTSTTKRQSLLKKIGRAYSQLRRTPFVFPTMRADSGKKFPSQIGQELFVLRALRYKKNGTFLDIGCGHPTYISNTLTLERDYGWRGIGIDIALCPDHFVPLSKRENLQGQSWATTRPHTVFHQHDALTVDYAKLLSDNMMPKNY